MTIDIEMDKQPEWNFDIADYTEKVIAGTADYEKCPYELEINVLLTGNEQIREINEQHRNIDTSTDVLSFPMLDYVRPAEFAHVEEDITAFHPESGELMLGDIVVSVEKAEEQAGKYGHTIAREYAFLIVHSMLHLFGYDHIDDTERQVMEKKQREILDALNIYR